MKILLLIALLHQASSSGTGAANDAADLCGPANGSQVKESPLSDCLGTAMVRLAYCIASSLNHPQSMRQLHTRLMSLTSTDTSDSMRALLASPVLANKGLVNFNFNTPPPNTTAPSTTSSTVVTNTTVAFTEQSPPRAPSMSTAAQPIVSSPGKERQTSPAALSSSPPTARPSSCKSSAQSAQKRKANASTTTLEKPGTSAPRPPPSSSVQASTKPKECASSPSPPAFQSILAHLTSRPWKQSGYQLLSKSRMEKWSRVMERVIRIVLLMLLSKKQDSGPLRAAIVGCALINTDLAPFTDVLTATIAMEGEATDSVRDAVFEQIWSVSKSSPNVTVKTASQVLAKLSGQIAVAVTHGDDNDEERSFKVARLLFTNVYLPLRQVPTRELVSGEYWSVEFAADFLYSSTVSIPGVLLRHDNLMEHTCWPLSELRRGLANWIAMRKLRPAAISCLLSDAVQLLPLEYSAVLTRLLPGPIKPGTVNVGVPRDGPSKRVFQKALSDGRLLGLLLAPETHLPVIMPFFGLTASGQELEDRARLTEAWLSRELADCKTLQEQVAIWTNRKVLRVLAMPRQWPELTLQLINSSASSTPHFQLRAFASFPWSPQDKEQCVRIFRQDRWFELPLDLHSDDIIIMAIKTSGLQSAKSLLDKLGPYIPKSNYSDMPSQTIASLAEETVVRARTASASPMEREQLTSVECTRRQMVDLLQVLLRMHDVGCVLVL